MQTLYHYCSTETFSSIVGNRSIRLSSLTMSNDSREGAVILEVLLSLAREADLNPTLQLRLERQLRQAYDFFDGFGFCLSEDGDLLSQWRGYADDGRGVSIGFNKQYFERMSSTLQERDERGFAIKRVIYDHDGQREVATEHFGRIKELLERGAFQSGLGSLLIPTTEEDRAAVKKATEDGHFAVLLAMLRMFEVKNPAFSEEREWRLISFISRKGSEDKIKFRACGDKLVPYLEFALERAI